jgi:DnaJ-class molecular chaperone
LNRQRIPESRIVAKRIVPYRSVLNNAEPDYYAILGLDSKCSSAQIQSAYRILAKRFHPDLNPGSAEAMERTQEINAAYEVLSSPADRRAYDESRAVRAANATRDSALHSRAIERNIAKDVHLRIEDFLRGTKLDVKVNDSGNPEGPETYQLVIPPETAPGARFRIPRTGAYKGGFVIVRTKALPGFRFKVRGSDLRCDLTTNSKRVALGGYEMITGATGSSVKVQIPPGIVRGGVIRISGEGLPKPRGGRGDLLVRVLYRPEVTITRSSRR